MRRLMVSALLGLGVLGFSVANEAKASWLSEALHNSQVSLNIGIGSQYPAYPAPVYAPAPVPVYAAPAYTPVPSYPVYRPVPVYNPAPVVPAPVCRPAPVSYPTPVNPPYPSYYGPNPYHHDWYGWRR